MGRSHQREYFYENQNGFNSMCVMRSLQELCNICVLHKTARSKTFFFFKIGQTLFCRNGDKLGVFIVNIFFLTYINVSNQCGSYLFGLNVPARLLLFFFEQVHTYLYIKIPVLKRVCGGCLIGVFKPVKNSMLQQKGKPLKKSVLKQKSLTIIIS